MKVLLIEDEAAIADFVVGGLGARGISVHAESDGRAGHAQALKPDWDAIVLDLMLPGRDGLDILADLRQRGIGTPVILLTARNELGDRLGGLQLGADDYMAKPFFVEELAARLQTVLRRAKGERQSELQVGGLLLDRIGRTVKLQGRAVELTGREFSLLEYLMRSPGEVFSRAQLLEAVWGYDFDPATNVVDVCVKRIRARLADVQHEEAPQPLIESVRGVGYRFRRPG
ncbi:response regulator transcription factor [Inhella proteolytica]|uniref:Response regulator transcription factor n=1 Tax=Inhella proteolytica TaxID=2795029 RepID=A0A931NF38_9BURK|nr:response regulator transcription factor [Inhella proteolytica]MBH9575671.1 response regulator transcription factor [Inhella proteolytica]